MAIDTQPRLRAPASPLARRLARESGLDVASLAGSGPDGRVVAADVLAAGRRGRADGLRDRTYEARLEVDLGRAIEVVSRSSALDPAVTLRDLVAKVCASALRRHLPTLQVAVLDPETLELPRNGGTCTIIDLSRYEVESATAPLPEGDSIFLILGLPGRGAVTVVTMLCNEDAVPCASGLAFLQTVGRFLAEPALAL